VASLRMRPLVLCRLLPAAPMPVRPTQDDPAPAIEVALVTREAGRRAKRRPEATAREGRADCCSQRCHQLFEVLPGRRRTKMHGSNSVGLALL